MRLRATLVPPTHHWGLCEGVLMPCNESHDWEIVCASLVTLPQMDDL